MVFWKKGLLSEIDIPKHNITIKSLKINNKKIYQSIHSYQSFIDDINNLEEKDNSDFRKDEILKQYINLEYENKNTEINSINYIKIPLIAHVTSGTYIRQLCKDIGNELNIPAIALYIERVDYIKNV